MNEEENIVEISDEKNDYYTDEDLFKIISWGADLSFRELITMYDEGELIKPEIQRHYVWDKSEASRFIDSLLLGLPVPSIFLAKKADTKLIVDGFQRIMTVYDFAKKGIFSKDGSVFKLSNSDKINEQWRGRTFIQLSEGEQRRILSTTIHSIIFEQKHPRNSDTSLYQIFERINTGGRTLLPQEIRNCIYQGKFNTLLINLNKDEKWRNLFGLWEVDSRMRDIESILRFFALASGNIKNSESKQISLKRTLNLFMGDEESNQEKVLKEREIDFLNTINFISENIGKNAFHNLSAKGDTFVERFHPTIFDSIAISTSYALKKHSSLKIENLKEKK